jgi:phosphoribosylanthranilate isomerase
MVKIKICGMTNLEDCLIAIDLGVDFIGFVFYEESRRYITPESVRTIVEKLDENIKTVGVFVKETEDQIKELMEFCKLDFAQVYNARSRPDRITVYRVDDSIPDVAKDGLILFDSYSEGFGGSGMSFDIELLRNHSALDRAFIAGGVNVENIGSIMALKPFGVDFVSSVEKYKGKKDLLKMSYLVNKIRSYEI